MISGAHTRLTIARAREALGLTQAAMAQALDLGGPNRQVRISKWERGAEPTPDHALRAAARLVVAAWWAERNDCPEPEVTAVDARWAAVLSAPLGEAYLLRARADGTAWAGELRPLIVALREDVCEALGLDTLPGV